MNINEKEVIKKRKKAGSLLNREKLDEEQREKNIERKNQKKQTKNLNEESKQRRNIKLLIEQSLEEMKSQIATQFEEIFLKEISDLKTEGLFYKCQYLGLTLDEVAKRGIKNLGKEGWVHCFDSDNKIYFQKIKNKE